ncbi:MAG: SapC family protein, partial [Acidisphaera sp.]|nr:SapC family protein [Acidisphaera sp.]
MPEHAPAGMPLFYHRVIGLDSSVHAALRLDRSVGFGFAAQAQSVPLGIGEFELAAQSYPIVFAGSGDRPFPVALLGIRTGQNLFVDAQGRWRPGAYTPQYVSAYPFISVQRATSQDVFIGIDPDAASLRTDRGTPLFEDGQPTSALREASQLCTRVRDNLAAARAMAAELAAAGLITEEEVTVTFATGDTTRIRGFKLLRPEALARIDDATFLDWRARGWLAPIYAHIFSAGRWARLIELTAQLPPA